MKFRREHGVESKTDLLELCSELQLGVFDHMPDIDDMGVRIFQLFVKLLLWRHRAQSTSQL